VVLRACGVVVEISNECLALRAGAMASTTSALATLLRPAPNPHPAPRTHSSQPAGPVGVRRLKPVRGVVVRGERAGR